MLKEYNYPLEKLDPKILTVMKVRQDNPEASLVELIEILDKDFPNDYFIVMSHVSSDKGLFKTSKPAIYSKWIDENIIRKKILAFDKISASDKVAYEQQVNIKRSQGVKVSKNIPLKLY